MVPAFPVAFSLPVCPYRAPTHGNEISCRFAIQFQPNQSSGRLRFEFPSVGLPRPSQLPGAVKKPFSTLGGIWERDFACTACTKCEFRDMVRCGGMADCVADPRTRFCPRTCLMTMSRQSFVKHTEHTSNVDIDTHETHTYGKLTPAWC